MAKKKTEPTEKIEREYIIPLREKCRPVPRYKKTPKAIKTIKEFLVRHMKIRDRDLDKIKIDKYLNEFMWGRGIKNPPHKIKIKAIKEGEIVKAELVEFPENLKFKKTKEERREQKTKEISEGKKKISEKAKKEIEKVKEKTEEEKKDSEQVQRSSALTQSVERKAEEKEKKASVVEAGKEIEKATAKQMKHQMGGKTKEPKHQRRVALQK